MQVMESSAELGYRPEAGYCASDKEYLSTVKGGKFNDQRCYYSASQGFCSTE